MEKKREGQKTKGKIKKRKIMLSKGFTLCSSVFFLKDQEKACYIDNDNNNNNNTSIQI